MASDLRLGYKASAEQFAAGAPRPLGTREELGLDIVGVSDHFQPWRRHGRPCFRGDAVAGRARPAARADGHVVPTPTMRYHPSVVAQSFATLRVWHRAASSRRRTVRRNMNETPPPGRSGRREGAPLRLRESIELMRRLWTEERVTFEGEYYRTERATVYDRPDEPVPVFVAAPGRSPRSSQAAWAMASSA